MYFNYHAKIKRLLEENQCVGYSFLDSYRGISPALVLYFKNDIPMPIREHRFAEYLTLLQEKGIPKLKVTEKD